jgi:hypothetical protein
MPDPAADLLDLRRRVATARLLIATHIVRSVTRDEALRALAEVLELLSRVEIDSGDC